jgi:hypothetical protein
MDRRRFGGAIQSGKKAKNTKKDRSNTHGERERERERNEGEGKRERGEPVFYSFDSLPFFERIFVHSSAHALIETVHQGESERERERVWNILRECRFYNVQCTPHPK